MNKYQRLLNRASKEAETNHKITIKLKHREKWLKGGTPINHPIHIAFEKEFDNPNYRQIRKTLRNELKNTEDFKEFIRRMNKEIKEKYFLLFNEDMKYDKR